MGVSFHQLPVGSWAIPLTCPHQLITKAFSICHVLCFCETFDQPQQDGTELACQENYHNLASQVPVCSASPGQYHCSSSPYFIDTGWGGLFNQSLFPFSFYIFSDDHTKPTIDNIASDIIQICIINTEIH